MKRDDERWVRLEQLLKDILGALVDIRKDLAGVIRALWLDGENGGKPPVQ
jgi:hypothetical protein